MEIPKSRVAVLGDRLETDILGARKAGLKSILVLTGVSSRQELKQSGSKPTLVIKDLPALQRAWIRSKERPGG
jgi:4-nitrophenyl phosphatase